MPDVFLDWNDDFIVSSSGGLLLAEGDDWSNQRIIRRLCTAVNSYVWHQEYGAGLLQRIGRPARAGAVQALVRAQIALEQSVAPQPAPQVTVVEDANQLGLFTITIQYLSNATGEPVTLSFTP